MIGAEAGVVDEQGEVGGVADALSQGVEVGWLREIGDDGLGVDAVGATHHGGPLVLLGAGADGGGRPSKALFPAKGAGF